MSCPRLETDWKEIKIDSKTSCSGYLKLSFFFRKTRVNIQ